MANFAFTNSFYNDEKGRTLPKSRLYFYDNGTFNFSDIYSDPELTQVLDNPVIADGAGRFPQIFMSTSKIYRVWLKDRKDNPVTPFIDDYTPVTFVGDLGNAAFVDLDSPEAVAEKDRVISVAANSVLEIGFSSGRKGGFLSYCDGCQPNNEYPQGGYCIFFYCDIGDTPTSSYIMAQGGGINLINSGLDNIPVVADGVDLELTLDIGGTSGKFYLINRTSTTRNGVINLT